MRHWTLQHPNVMVVVWAVVVVLLGFTVVDHINDREWFWLGVSAVAQLGALENLRRWWART